MGVVFADAALGGAYQIVAEMPSSTGRLTVRVLEGQTPLCSIELPYPGGGLGGGTFVVSPTGRYAILSIFSGQSEQGYELFKLDGERIEKIEHVGSLPYVIGMGADFAFAPGEQQFAMVMAFDCDFDLHDDRWEDKDLEVRDGLRIYPFGELRLHTIATGGIETYSIDVAVRLGSEPEARPGWSDRLGVAFPNSQEVLFNLPWGTRVTIGVPPRQGWVLVEA